LLTNCYKHAFTNQANGIIDISFTETNSECTLSVKDNGGGLPINYSKKQSLGITVIEALSEQLEGTFSFTNNNGTCFELKFKY
ncbi:MAG: sensor histidine kinase, partial [Bacteroidia bacterium]|nr:sensor histidine kinase [Bacteroidia bacterium]